MTDMAAVARPSRAPALTVRMAASAAEIEAAQRLRHQVFAGELGARLPDAAGGLDRDDFDPHCEHLIATDEAAGRVVGTYRILPAERAHALGRYYSEGEFDLAPLAGLRRHLVEVGRSCVHRDYRSGAVIALLWSGLARYVLERDARYLMGCASVSLADGGGLAGRLYNSLRCTAACPPRWRVRPHRPLPPVLLAHRGGAVPPPLLKGYLRLGARICGEPAWDPDFNTADLLLLLPVERIAARYAQHFGLRAATRAA